MNKTARLSIPIICTFLLLAGCSELPDLTPPTAENDPSSEAKETGGADSEAVGDDTGSVPEDDTGVPSGTDDDTGSAQTGTDDDTDSFADTDTATYSEMDTGGANRCEGNEELGCHANDVWCMSSGSLPISLHDQCIGGKQCVDKAEGPAQCICVSDWSQGCYAGDPWVYDSCGDFNHIIALCDDVDECWVDTDGQAACCTPSYRTACVDDGASGQVFHFDSCDRQESLMEDCQGNSVCASTGALSAACICRNAWSGSDCNDCPGNWDATSDCATCLNHWQDNGDECGTCPENWDAASDCNACVNGFDPSTNCTSCLPGWSGADCTVQDQCIRYVNGQSTAPFANGYGWTTAFSNLQDALGSTSELATQGAPCEIWVAEGMYTPSDAGIRVANFSIPANVALYCGFKATGEPTWNDRDHQNHVTILSGEIGDSETVEDNSVHVVEISYVDNVTVDGCTIRHGYAEHEYYPEGAGIRVTHSEGSLVRNCTFENNWAKRGGAMNIGASTVTIEDCTFQDNTAYQGGALAISGSTLLATRCDFLGNEVSDGPNGDDAEGGAVWISGSSFVFDECNFTNNSGLNPFGSAVMIFNLGTYNQVFRNSSFRYNTGAPTIYADRTVGIVFDGTQITDNDDTGMRLFASSVALVDSTVSRNKRGIDAYGSLLLLDSTIDQNDFEGIIIRRSEMAIIGGQIHANGYESIKPEYTTPTGGSGISLDESSLVMHNSTIVSNKTKGSGGGIRRDCIDATESLYFEITGSTIANNYADWYHGAIEAGCGQPASITNSIIWDNPTLNSGTNSPIGCNHFDVSYSDVEGGCPGEGNIDAAPMFGPGFELEQSSPCVDAGNDTYGLMLDKHSKARHDHPAVANCADPSDTDDPACNWFSDMGAFEREGSLQTGANHGCSTPIAWPTNGHSYWTCPVPLPWHLASHYCRATGGQLLQVTDQAENDFAYGLLGTPSWIGGQGVEFTGNWYWQNHFPSIGWSFDNWAMSEPQYDPESGITCATMDPGGDWFAQPCGEFLPFVCEGE